MPLLSSLLRRESVGEDRVALAGDTHQGLVRTQNEDSFLTVSDARQDALLLAVADGMGGHECGEIASHLTMHYLLRQWHNRTEREFTSREAICDFMGHALHLANRHIFHVNRVLRIRFPMGTTATLAVLWQNKLVVGHVGDSRCYRLRRGKLRQLTSDHNWQAEMVRGGMLGRQEAVAHPLSNMLTNCIGALPQPRIDFLVSTVAPGDRYLVCTDGISSMVTDDEIQLLLNASSEATEAVKRLIHQGLRNGGMDNLTAVCLFH